MGAHLLSVNKRRHQQTDSSTVARSHQHKLPPNVTQCRCDTMMVLKSNAANHTFSIPHSVMRLILLWCATQYRPDNATSSTGKLTTAPQSECTRRTLLDRLHFLTDHSPAKYSSNTSSAQLLQASARFLRRGVHHARISTRLREHRRNCTAGRKCRWPGWTVR